MATKKPATTKKPSTSKKTVSTKNAKVIKPTKKVASQPARAAVPSFQESIRHASFWRSLAAEFIGVFLLAAAIIVGQAQPLYTLFAVVGIVLLVGTVSGAYLNPALAIAGWVTRRISLLRSIGYIVAQVLGALVALVTMSYFVGGAVVDPNAAMLGATGPEVFKASALSENAYWYVFFAELLGATILGFAVANALRGAQSRLTSAFTYGLGVFIALMIGFIAASYVGATSILNPAVAFSLQAVHWNVWPIAIYILAPVVGGIVGFFINDLLKGRTAK